MFDDIKEMLGYLVFILLFISPVFLILIPVYYSSCRAAQIYNIKNNTQYTCSDFFWVGDQINSATSTVKLETK